MKKPDKIIVLLLALLLVLTLTITFLILTKPQTPTYYRVERIIDGDTIVLENKETVRYIGLDTPELHHPSIGEECGGKEAANLNSKLLTGKRVRLISDVTDKDAYGRLLRYVFTEDGTFINYEIIRQGYAQTFNIPPNNLMTKTLTQAQLDAKKDNRGLWTTCYKPTK